MKIPMSKEDVRSIFDGILTGEGDIFARMASSHVDAANPYNVYPYEIAGTVALIQSTMIPGSRLFGMGAEFANSFLDDEENEFLEDDEIGAENTEPETEETDAV